MAGAPPQVSMPFEFLEERVFLYIWEDKYEVDNCFYFRNVTGIDYKIPVEIQFRIDDSIRYPFEVSAYQFIRIINRFLLKIKEDRKRGNVEISVPMKSNQTAYWILEYKQKVDKDRVAYIARSGQIWRSTPVEAEYRIYLPKNYELEYIWAEVDSVTQYKDWNVLWICRSNYTCDEDMVVKWRCK